MIGAERIYNIVLKTNRYNLGGCTTRFPSYGNMAVRRGHVLLIAGSHARGETCHIILEAGNDTLEVYGIIGGQPGWTEEYGWIRKGKWVEPINDLLTKLENEIAVYEQKVEEKRAQRIRESQQSEEERTAKFESLFNEV